MKKLLQNENLKFLLLIAVVLIAGVGVAYAALSTTLNVTFNKITQNALTWDVHFVTGSGTVTGTPSGTSATGRTCGAATVNATSVTVADSAVSKPGDVCTYALQIENGGTVGAILNSITLTDPTGLTCTKSGASMTCGNVTYKLATNDTGTTLLTTNSTLAANATQDVYLIVKYDPEDTLQSTAIEQTGAQFTLVYNQN